MYRRGKGAFPLPAHPIAFEDGNFTGTLTSRAPVAFVSNFGASYRLPVR